MKDVTSAATSARTCYPASKQFHGVNVFITILLLCLSLIGNAHLMLALFTGVSMLLAQRSLYACYKVEQPVVPILHAFFFLGISAVLTPWMLLLIPFFLWHTGVLMRCLTWRVFWAGVFGLSVPYVFMTLLSLLSENTEYFNSLHTAFTTRPWLYVVFIAAYPMHVMVDYFCRFSIWQWIPWGLISLLGIFCIWHFFHTRHRSMIQQRLEAYIAVHNSVALWGLIFIFPQFYYSLIGGLAACLSPLVIRFAEQCRNS